MRRLPGALQRVEFHLLWFFISLILFSAPVALVSSHQQPQQLMLAFFLPWLASLAVLFVISRGYHTSPGDDDHGPEPPEV